MTATTAMADATHLFAILIGDFPAYASTDPFEFSRADKATDWVAHIFKVLRMPATHLAHRPDGQGLDRDPNLRHEVGTLPENVKNGRQRRRCTAS
jgi:hypothetical protein